MITTARPLACGLFLLAIVAAAGAGPREPVAIIYQVSGDALRTFPGGSPEPVRLFDRLPAGTGLELKPGSRLSLAFVSGKRYELSGPARATLGKGDLSARSGGVRPLPPVPPLPRLAAIAKDDHPGPKSGAIRIRGEGIGHLVPREGATTLAGATVLRFQTAGASRYRVEIEDLRGNVVFRTVTEVFSVSVPPRILAPGASYHWTVKVLDQPGPEARGEASFVTLSTADTKARERLRKAVETLGDGDSRDLLVAVDHALGLVSEDTQEENGAVVESVAPQSPGEAAGLRPGDVVLSWSSAAALPTIPQPAGGAVRSPYDLLAPEIEEAPRRPVLLLGKRGVQAMTWRLTAGEWGIETRPGHPERFPTWALGQRAKELAAAGKWPEADAAYAAALESETVGPAAVWLLHRWGKTFEQRGAWDAAVERYRKALELERTTAPKSLAEAGILNALGVMAAKRGDYPAAEKFLQQALAIREELAPGTAEITSSLNNLGTLARVRGDLDAAETYLLRGEELQRRLAPESSDHALLFQNLGNLAGMLGELKRAETYHRQALAIFERIDPEGGGVVGCLGNLANVLIQEGDLAAADGLLRRSLAIQQRHAPDETELSMTLVSLGNLAYRRGDLEDSEARYRRALAIQERFDPDGPGVSMCLANLGGVKDLQGDFAAARTYLRRSLALEERLVPGGLDVAQGLEQLGHLEMNSGGDLARAEKLLRRALAIFEGKAPASLETSETLFDLAEVATRRGRRTAAIAFGRKALDLEHRLAPGTTGEAAALHVLGVAERQAGRSGAGTRHLCGAIDVLDRQRAKIGSAQEVKTAFEATLGDYYQDCLEDLAGAGRRDEAFHALERGRARTFLALLSERDLRLAELPPELAAERRRIDSQYDQVQSQLARLSAGRNGEEIERLTSELRDLRTRQEEIRSRIRRESPRSAALQDPQPLDLADARAALDPGTVLLEYSVGRESTWLFVVQPADTPGPGLSVFRIAAGQKALREQVESFRRLLDRPGSDRATLQARARRLYRLLVRPAESRISGARRILVSPDGPLHTLCFAALRRGGHYLVEWKPIHSVLSATVYAELTRSRPAGRNPGAERLVAFGDPVYPPIAHDVPADPEVREARRRGLNLTPLPSTRKEVQAIAVLFPEGREYLGREATEERAKSVGPDARLLHFACHGLLDERFPLNSALALTLPEHPAAGQDNGLLQAWEIFESVRLDADLVTLSACDTALGKEMGGEGLVGLTRAFQYAGARSVLASLWGVADDSTAAFMENFYGHLRSGEAKDEALRAAQIEQIRKKSHPFFWAAFQLTGDWR